MYKSICSGTIHKQHIEVFAHVVFILAIKLPPEYLRTAIS